MNPHHTTPTYYAGGGNQPNNNPYNAKHLQQQQQSQPKQLQNNFNNVNSFSQDFYGYDNASSSSFSNDFLVNDPMSMSIDPSMLFGNSDAVISPEEFSQPPPSKKIATAGQTSQPKPTPIPSKPVNIPPTGPSNLPLPGHVAVVQQKTNQVLRPTMNLQQQQQQYSQPQQYFPPQYQQQMNVQQHPPMAFQRQPVPLPHTNIPQQQLQPQPQPQVPIPRRTAQDVYLFRAPLRFGDHGLNLGNIIPWSVTLSRDAFLKSIIGFGHAIGRPLPNLPNIHTEQISLFALFNNVIQMNGFFKVCEIAGWKVICDNLRVNPTIPNMLALRDYYAEWVLPYELFFVWKKSITQLEFFCPGQTSPEYRATLVPNRDYLPKNILPTVPQPHPVMPNPRGQSQQFQSQQQQLQQKQSLPMSVPTMQQPIQSITQPSAAQPQHLPNKPSVQTRSQPAKSSLTQQQSHSATSAPQRKLSDVSNINRKIEIQNVMTIPRIINTAGGYSLNEIDQAAEIYKKKTKKRLAFTRATLTEIWLLFRSRRQANVIQGLNMIAAASENLDQNSAVIPSDLLFFLLKLHFTQLQDLKITSGTKETIFLSVFEVYNRNMKRIENFQTLSNNFSETIILHISYIFRNLCFYRKVLGEDVLNLPIFKEYVGSIVMQQGFYDSFQLLVNGLIIANKIVDAIDMHAPHDVPKFLELVVISAGKDLLNFAVPYMNLLDPVEYFGDVEGTKKLMLITMNSSNNICKNIPGLVFCVLETYAKISYLPYNRDFMKQIPFVLYYFIEVIEVIYNLLFLPLNHYLYVLQLLKYTEPSPQHQSWVMLLSNHTGFGIPDSGYLELCLTALYNTIASIPEGEVSKVKCLDSLCNVLIQLCEKSAALWDSESPSSRKSLVQQTQILPAENLPQFIHCNSSNTFLVLRKASRILLLIVKACPELPLWSSHKSMIVQMTTLKEGSSPYPLSEISSTFLEILSVVQD